MHRAAALPISIAALLRACSTAGRAMAASTPFVPPPRELLRPLAVPYRLLLGPGPSNVSPRVRAAGGQQILGHMHPEVLQVSGSAPAAHTPCITGLMAVLLLISGDG